MRRLTAFYVKVVFVAAVAVALLSAQTPTPQPADRVSEHAVVQALLKQFNVPGASIAIIKDFKVTAAYAYGVADVETGAPVTPETLFQAASISKPVRGDGVAEGGSGREVPARSGHQQF